MSEVVISKLESTMHSLTERVGRHEDRLEAAINNMSNKLDALVEISRTMATLQERQTQHADGIAELKNDMREQREQHAETIREILVAHEKTIGRLHERIDQLDRHIGSVAQEAKAAVAEHAKEEGAFHDKVTKLSHEWELRYAHSEKDQLNQTAEFAASLGALEKRFDNFFANVEGMKKMAYVLWAVMGGGVLLGGGKLVRARPGRDLTSELFSRTSGSAAPTLTLFRGMLYAWQFSPNTMQSLYATSHMPHDYVPGTPIHLHVHWSEASTRLGGWTRTRSRRCCGGWRVKKSKGEHPYPHGYGSSLSLRRS